MEPTIESEYNKYLQTAQILAETPGTNEYEKANSVERLMLALANTMIDPQQAYEQFVRETKSKQHVSDKIAELAAERAREILSNAPREQQATVMAKIIGGMFTYRDYTRKISPGRMRLLRNLGGDHATALMLMRYATIMPGSQHWNVPHETYEVLYSAGYHLEAFASPVNSQLIAYPGTSFCSLFPDVDKPFGSIGSFFDVALEGTFAVINPPYIDSMFIAIANKLSTVNTKLPTKFYITTAAWQDSEGFQLLLAQARFAAILPANSHFYRNTNDTSDPTGVKIVAKFPTAIFEIAHNMPCEPIEYYEKIIRSNCVGRPQYDLLKHDSA